MQFRAHQGEQASGSTAVRKFHGTGCGTWCGGSAITRSPPSTERRVKTTAIAILAAAHIYTSGGLGQSIPPKAL